MSEFQVGWRADLLHQADIPATRFALDILDAWQRSTPLAAWTNNPLGYPYLPGKNTSALNTPYAMFYSMRSFRDFMTIFLKSPQGTDIRHALATQDKPSVAWRAISSLGWPGSTLETDYPSAVLDMTDQAYRDSVKASAPADRKTTGLIGGTSPLQGLTGRAPLAVRNNTAALASSASALRNLLRRNG
jgi:hypothetical protein